MASKKFMLSVLFSSMRFRILLVNSRVTVYPLEG